MILEKSLKKHSGRIGEIVTISGIWITGLLTVLSLCGCVSKTKVQAEVRAAYAAGQRDAYAHMAADQRTSVKVFGPVQNPEVSWVEGLTLAQAVATANYMAHGNPQEIILLRRGESATIDPSDLLNGHDVPLEPGDTVTLH